MPLSRVVVGGFSQGAAVALLMLRSELPLAGVLALSGFLPLAQEEPLVAGWEGMRAGGCDGAVVVVMRACVPRMCVEGLVRGMHAMCWCVGGMQCSSPQWTNLCPARTLHRSSFIAWLVWGPISRLDSPPAQRRGQCPDTDAAAARRC